MEHLQFLLYVLVLGIKFGDIVAEDKTGSMSDIKREGKLMIIIRNYIANNFSAIYNLTTPR